MKCYIIRLESNEHSCKVAKECYEQAVKHGLQPEFFSAVDGQEADYHYEQTGLSKAKKFKKNRPGVMGCFFSHYYIWKECLETNEPIIVLEHDGYVIKSIPSIFLEMFTDILKLDDQDPFSKNYNEEVEASKIDSVEIRKYNNPKAKKTSSKKFDGTGNYFRGTYSYIIKPKGAQKLIDFVKEYGHLPADQQIGDRVLDTRVTTETYARLHPFYSEGENIKEFSLTKHL